MVASALYLSTAMCYGHYDSQYMMVRKTRFNPPLQKTSFDQGGMETSFDIGGMTNEFNTGGIRNEIQQVGINRMIHTSGIGNTLSVQYGSDKNHYLSGLDQSTNRRLRYILGYIFFWKNITFRIVGLTTFRGISLQVTYFFYILKIYKYNKEYLCVCLLSVKFCRKIVFAYFFVTCNRIF